MPDAFNDNRPPTPSRRRRRVPLIGILHDDGRLERCQVVELLPHPLDLLDQLACDDRERT